MVELERPTNDGMCAILSKEEIELHNAENMNRLHLFDCLWDAVSQSSKELNWVKNAEEALEGFRKLPHSVHL